MTIRATKAIRGDSSGSAVPDSMPDPAAAGIRRPELVWLSEVLGQTITAMESLEIGASRGFLSTTWRVQLQTDPASALPSSLVLKSESSQPLFQAIARKRNAFAREIAFYQNIAPAIKAPVPRIYAMGNADDCWLLMEDLIDHRAGDQVRGLSQDEVRAVVRAMASIHAQFWLNSELTNYSWLPANLYWFSEIDHSLLTPFLHDYSRRIGERVSTVMVECLAQLAEIDAAIACRPFTLVHGDLRADNLMFIGEDHNPRPTILDWQSASCSLGALDLAYLLGGSEPLAERSGHLEELLYLWHGDLQANGVADYSLSEARRDLQLGALRCLAVALRLYATLYDPDTTVRGALFRDEAILRHCAVVDELRAWEALPQPIAA
jgi:aminoglycoside/choline kinase family phosphotransferase